MMGWVGWSATVGGITEAACGDCAQPPAECARPPAALWGAGRLGEDGAGRLVGVEAKGGHAGSMVHGLRGLNIWRAEHMAG